MKSKGQLEYEAHVAARPNYDDGAPRVGWDKLKPLEQWTWERPQVWCPHGFRLADNVCGICSEGRPNK